MILPGFKIYKKLFWFNVTNLNQRIIQKYFTVFDIITLFWTNHVKVFTSFYFPCQSQSPILELFGFIFLNGCLGFDSAPD